MSKRYSIIKLTSEEINQIKSLFSSDYSILKIATLSNVDPQVIAEIFEKEFGVEKTRERGKLQNQKRELQVVESTCQKCGKSFSLRKTQLVKLQRGKGILCPDCKSKRDFITQETHICPVCGLRTHRRHSFTSHIKFKALKDKDLEHLNYYNQILAQEWEGKELNADYVECHLCKQEGKPFSEYRMPTLHKHVPSIHHMSVKEYAQRFNSPSAAIKHEEVRKKSISEDPSTRTREFYSIIKQTHCEKCQKEISISAFRSLEQYEILCFDCKLQQAQELFNIQWKDKIEGIDYVECKVLNCKDEFGLLFRTPNNLKDHLRFEHKLSPEQYELLYSSKHYIEQKIPGCGILEVRLDAERKRRGDQESLISEVNICIICGEEKPPDQLLKNLCFDCIKREEDQDGNLYCKFPDCGFKSPFLGTHIPKTHKFSTIQYCELFPGSYFVSSKVRQKMSEEGGWSKDLTKENDPRIQVLSEAKKGISSWNKSLTLESDQRIQVKTEHLRTTLLEQRIVPGYVHQSTLQIISLTLEDFKPYLNKKGKLIIGRATRGLGISYPIVAREAQNLNLEVADSRVAQHLVLEAISKITKQSFSEEHTFEDIINPQSGRRFVYDGYFSTLNLIVEFHGYQHYIFPNHCHKNIVDFKKGQERDYLKQELALSFGYRYLIIKFDYPYEDEEFLRSKLKEIVY